MRRRPPLAVTMQGGRERTRLACGVWRPAEHLRHTHVSPLNGWPDSSLPVPATGRRLRVLLRVYWCSFLVQLHRQGLRRASPRFASDIIWPPAPFVWSGSADQDSGTGYWDYPWNRQRHPGDRGSFSQVRPGWQSRGLRQKLASCW